MLFVFVFDEFLCFVGSDVARFVLVSFVVRKLSGIILFRLSLAMLFFAKSGDFDLLSSTLSFFALLLFLEKFFFVLSTETDVSIFLII